MSLFGIYLAIVGDQQQFDARHRIINGIAFIATVLTPAIAVTDYIFDRSFSFGGASAAFVASLLLYTYYRILKRAGTWPFIAATLCYLAVFGVSWFDQGGIMGSSAFLIILLLPATLLVSPSKYRYLLFLSVSAGFAALVLLEAFDPTVAVNGSLASMRLFESLVVFLVCAGGTAGLFVVGMRSLRSEKARAEDYAARIEELASTDTLTGLLTHTAIWKVLHDEIVRAGRTRRNFSLVMADLDRFKSINGCFGHIQGDRVLERTGRAILDSIRSTDRAGRYGGEEFLVVLPETGLEGAASVAHRMLANLAGLHVSDSESGWFVSCSFGVVEFDGRTGAELIESADEFMYRAKSLGGGRVCGPDGVMAAADEAESA